MLKAMKQFFFGPLKDKKNRNIVYLFLIYAAVIAGICLLPINPIIDILLIGCACIVFIIVFVPFIAWYKVYYKEDGE